VSAGGVVFRRTADGPQFVLIKANGHWGFPKGNIEKDETPELTALREISEETGLPLKRLRIVRQLPPVKYAFRWEGRLVFKTVHNYLVLLDGEAAFNPQLSEVEEAQWFTPSGARRAISFKNSRQTLDAAIAGVAAGQVAS
jgi:8-oxo-dGTP pyrophosphatase MutT (NUDIX family)